MKKLGYFDTDLLVMFYGKYFDDISDCLNYFSSFADYFADVCSICPPEPSS